MAWSKLLTFLLSLNILVLCVNGQDYNVTIMVTPNMTSYTVGGNLMLRCVVDPVPSSTAITVTYSWECFGCFANEMNSSVINQVLTDMDTSMINCSATINGTVYRSDVFDLQVTQDAPINVSAIVLTSTSVEVRWIPSNLISNVTGYLIVYTTTASYTDGGNMTINGRNTANGIITGLEEYTLYAITVRAISVSGMISGDSDEVSVRTYTDVPSLPPRNIIVTVVHPRSLNISWLPPDQIGQNGPIISYTIRYFVVNRPNETMDESVSNLNMYSLTRLIPYVNYSIAVAAMTINGTGNYSDPIIEESGHDEPSAPRFFTVNATTNTTISLSWLPPMMPNGILTQYYLEYTEEENTLSPQFFLKFSRLPLPFSYLSYTITGLTPGTTYVFRVAAVTIVGRGPYAMSITSTTLKPSAPRFFTVNATTHTTVTLSWMPPMMPNGILTRYDLEFTEEGNVLSPQLFSQFTRLLLPFSYLSYTITGLTPDTTYVFRVAAVTIVGRGPYAMIITSTTLTPVVNIVSSPAGTPVVGSINTFDYLILSSVTLICSLNFLPVSNVSYSWNTMRCYSNSNYNGGNPRCFPRAQTTRNVTGYSLTAEDAGTITCTVTFDSNQYTSEPFTIRVSSIAITGRRDSTFPDYSYINAEEPAANSSVLLARCVSGLGPSDGDDNNALGGFYFNGTRISNGVCDSSVIQPSGATISSAVGVIDLHQCGAFSTTGEGVYTCTLQNSSMIEQSMRLGIYLAGRTAPVIITESGTTVDVNIMANYTLFCVSEGSPPDTFTWQKDDDPAMLSSTSITAITHTSTSAVFRAEYTITRASTNDNGTYTCTVTNPIGSDSTNITIMTIVPAPPNVTVSPSDPIQGAMVGSSQVITCTAVTPFLLDVVFDWVGPKGSIIADNRVNISPITSNGNTYTSSLQFTHLMEGDEGSYTCNVSLISARSVSASDYVEILSLTVSPLIRTTSPTPASTSTSAPTTTPPPTTSPDPADDDNGANGGATAGGVIAAIVTMTVIVVVVVVIVVLRRRHHNRKSLHMKKVTNTDTKNVIMSCMVPEQPSPMAELMTVTYADSTFIINPGLGKSPSSEVPQDNNWNNKLVSCLSDYNLLEIEKTIAQGNFGIVYTGCYGREKEKVRVAIKAIKDISLSSVKEFIDECITASKFDHPNVLSIIGVSINPETNMPLMIMPFMHNGSVQSYVKSKRGSIVLITSFPEGLSHQVLMQMCLDIAKGMEYLSLRYFIHRDLAARNCMLDQKMTVKVADFGLARDVYIDSYYTSENKSKPLPVKWLAPEALLDRKFNEKTDVWAFGVTCWEIFSLGLHPYPSISAFEICNHVKSGGVPDQPSLSSDEMYEIMRSCWNFLPEERPAFTTLVQNISQQLQLEVDNQKLDEDSEDTYLQIQCT